DTAYITDNDGNQIFKLLKGTINATIIANATKPADVVVDTSGKENMQEGGPRLPIQPNYIVHLYKLACHKF
ncbi:unnamed protein product, partial [Didymodactylos carnosus]